MLLAAAGLRNEQIQQELGVSKPVVVKWRSRFAARRLDGLVDEAGRGRKHTYGVDIRHMIASPRDVPCTAGRQPVYHCKSESHLRCCLTTINIFLNILAL